MKRIAYIYTALMMGLCLLTAGYNDAFGRKDRGKTEKMPEFTYFTLDGKEFTKKDLNKESDYLFVYFNPLCELCHMETETLIENIEFFEDIQIVMVSPSDVSEISQFIENYSLKNYPQMTVLHDKNDTFYKEFGAIGYPNLFAYDRDLELIRYFDHATDFRDIRDVFEPVYSRKR